MRVQIHPTLTDTEETQAAAGSTPKSVHAMVVIAGWQLPMRNCNNRWVATSSLAIRSVTFLPPKLTSIRELPPVRAVDTAAVPVTHAARQI